MNSMTGFGRGAAQGAGFSIQVEASTVNRKNLDPQVNLPRAFQALEPLCLKAIQSRIARGRVNLKVGIDAVSVAAGVALDMARAEWVMAASRQLAESHGLEPIRSVFELLRIPDVLKSTDSVPDLDAAMPVLEQALTEALDELLAMRRREGVHLADVLSQAVDVLEAVALEIEPLLQPAREAMVAKLRQGLADLGLPPDPQDPRLLQEIALYAERSDVREELDRIRGHLAQVRERLRSDAPVGRALDFLAQELAREFNTLSVKSPGIEINRLALRGKEGVEVFREQVQNVE